MRDGEVHTRTIDPREVGIAYAKLSDLTVNSADESADALRRIFNGEKGPRYDIAALNAAAALVVAERVANLVAGLDLARQALDAGRARQTLEALVRYSQSS